MCTRIVGLTFTRWMTGCSSLSLLGQYKMNYSHNGVVEVQLGIVKEIEKMAMQYSHRKWWQIEFD